MYHKFIAHLDILLVPFHDLKVEGSDATSESSTWIGYVVLVGAHNVEVEECCGGDVEARRCHALGEPDLRWYVN